MIEAILPQYSVTQHYRPTLLNYIVEPKDTSEQNEEVKDKPSPGTEGAAQWSEKKEGACGTSADEIPGILTR